MGLNKYSLFNDMWFNFNYTTKNPEIIKAAEELLKEIKAYTGKKGQCKNRIHGKITFEFKSRSQNS
ncbi:MAG: hypothetical protein IPN57_08095 [Ignavibacteria bacterium]|nr:hypothetical protein [Ignavibacteria bacterium]